MFYVAYSTVNLLAYDTTSRLARHELSFARPPGIKQPSGDRWTLTSRSRSPNRDLGILGVARLVKLSLSDRLQE